MKKKTIDPRISEGIRELQNKYAESPYTTNAGMIIRTIARFIPLDIVLKLLTAKKPRN